MQLAVNIVVLASISALISCGYVLIYRVSRVLSLAHGELMTLGAYGLYATASLFSGHPVVAVLAAVLATIALGIFLRGAMVLVWSVQEQHPARLLSVENVSIGVSDNARISVVGATLVAATTAVYL